jgi:colanic acid/amylovoran biosynthesis glycosyltransferase
MHASPASAHVGFVVNDFPVLSETFILSQIHGLMQRGFRVTVICDHPREPVLESDALCVQTRWKAEPLLHRLLEKLPGRLRGGIIAGADMAFDRRLNRYDLLIAHFGQNGARLARSRATGVLRRPFFTFFHGYDVSLPLHAGRMGAFRRLFKSRELLLPVSHYFRDILVSAGADPACVQVHRMGVDCDAIPYAFRLRADTLEILTVCRLVEKKGVEYAIRALALLSRRRPELRWRYTVIGDGPLLASLQTLAAEEGVAEHVQFTGALAHDAVKASLRAHDLFLLPSVTARNGDTEGVPVALMEAMAAGLLAVSSRHSGIPELIAHNQSGLLAGERDAQELSRHLEWAADHPQDCERLALNARAAVERNFNNRALHDALARRITQRLGAPL